MKKKNKKNLKPNIKMNKNMKMTIFKVSINIQGSDDKNEIN